ncbi:MAG: hypothetical protein Kow0090_20290 [Myxococcota bacterium]
MNRKIIIKAIIAFAMTPSLATADTPKKVAVLPFQALKGVETDTTEALYDAFVGEARKNPKFVITATKEVEELLGFESKKQMLGCSESSCAVEIAGALGVDEVVFSSVARFADSYSISIKRLDAMNAGVVSQFSEIISGGEKELLITIKQAAQSLFGDGKPPPEEEKVVAKEPEKKRGGAHWTLYLAAGVGSVGLITGIVGTIVYFKAQSELEDLKRQSPVNRKLIDDNQKKGENGSLMINVGYGVAAAGALGALLIGVLSGDNDQKSSKETALLPVIYDGGGGVAIKMGY